MSDHEGRQRVWWANGLIWAPNAWAWPKPKPLWNGESLPDNAVELVPRADRNELREAIEFVVYHCVEEMCEPDITDRVLAVLSERGLV
jgi:hypothetical protein